MSHALGDERLGKGLRLAPVRRRGGRGPLGHEHDLDGLGAAGHALGAGLGAVPGPAHPAVALRVDAVVDVVFLGDISGEPDLDRLDAAGLADIPTQPQPAARSRSSWVWRPSNISRSSKPPDADSCRP